MCGQWGDKGVTKKNGTLTGDMGFSEAEKVIEEVSGFRSAVTLFGGEPLIHGKIDDIVRLVKRNRMHCLMITNGYLLKEHAAALTEAGLDELNISIDGPEKTHDSIRGREGLFRKIKSGVQEVNKLKKGRKPLINLQTTITSYNLESLSDMPDTAAELGADSLTYHHLIFLDESCIGATRSGFPPLGENSWEGFAFDPGIEPEELWEKLKRAKEKSRSAGVDVNIYPNFTREEMIRYYADPAWFPESYSGKCKSPWICAYIFPDGELRPCLNFGYSFGNLGESSFKDTWNSPEALRFRNMLSGCGRFPVCGRCTEIFRY